MTMTELPVLDLNAEDPEMRAALAAGWQRADLSWERLQEDGNACFASGDKSGATRAWWRAWWIALQNIPASDPRRAATLANLALADRLAGHEGRAKSRYKEAEGIWRRALNNIDQMTIAPRARSSLFHLRMEARHRDTYLDIMRTRLREIGAETSAALTSLRANEPVECRLYGRWKGEKPVVFDDTRKFLSAALLICSGQNPAESLRTVLPFPPPSNEEKSGEKIVAQQTHQGGLNAT